MSTNLYLQIGKKKCLNKGLKFLIEPYLLDREGSAEVSHSFLEYLRGLLAMMQDDDERRADLLEIIDGAERQDCPIYLSVEE